MSADNELAAQMAAISIVNSPELYEKVGSTYALARLQTSFNDSKDRVESARSLLIMTQPHQVTPELAEYIDGELSSVGALKVDGTTVKGTESLGWDMHPSQYLKTRLDGCESFLSGFGAKATFIAKQIAAAFKDAWVMIKENNDSLLIRLNELDKDVDAAGKFDSGTSDIHLGFRLYNLFLVNREIKEDWTNQVSKVSKTISGLSNNYYVLSKNNLNSIMSYYGGFDGLDEAGALARFLQFPLSIPSVRFKECNLQDRTYISKNVAAYRSIEMLGGRYFLDTRIVDRELHPKDVHAARHAINLYLETDKTAFSSAPEKEYNDVRDSIKTLGSQDIKEIVRLCRTVLSDWEKVCADGDKHKLVDRDYEATMKELLALDVDEHLRNEICSTFNATITKNQTELLDLRAKVSTYLVFLINGLVELCYTSIQLNQE